MTHRSPPAAWMVARGASTLSARWFSASTAARRRQARDAAWRWSRYASPPRAPCSPLLPASARGSAPPATPASEDRWRASPPTSDTATDGAVSPLSPPPHDVDDEGVGGAGEGGYTGVR